MDNEQDTCQAKGCDTFRCETNNSITQSQAVVNPEMWGNEHLAIICHDTCVHKWHPTIYQHCCLSESISSKKLQPVVFLFVFSSACRWLVSVHWAVQLQFNKPYGCWITLTSKYYKCPELDSFLFSWFFKIPTTDHRICLTFCLL